MITPIMIEKISWGTYLFFAAMNACFIPVIYFFYPETSRRSLEEIDLIFAKGYVENMSYVKASFELPHLQEHDIDRVARQYGLVDSDAEATVGDDNDEKVVVERSSDDERTRVGSDASEADLTPERVGVGALHRDYSR
jgi:hypothetical protein